MGTVLVLLIAFPGRIVYGACSKIARKIRDCGCEGELFLCFIVKSL